MNDNRIKDNWVRTLLIVAGTFFTGLGIFGAFVPVLPTTPFFLLAAACYARSSQRFYRWLLENRWFGSCIRGYVEIKRSASEGEGSDNRTFVGNNWGFSGICHQRPRRQSSTNLNHHRCHHIYPAHPDRKTMNHTHYQISCFRP